MREIQRNNVVEEQRAKDYGGHQLCIIMEYGEYMTAPKKKKELERKIKNKEYKNEYELQELESELRMAKSSIEHAETTLYSAKSCIERAEKYEKEHNIEISQKEKDLREEIKNTKYKEAEMNK